ncbi:MAG TPA: MarR family transcriptional regulator [Kouleothrix sp.]|uniref:MarR family winged helix-turn-helix transcriptional regulator n=1 Tax=Kouleothrix sp. TaxID=2779161 RepID=UPI002B63BF82|nr:MarR family transcriptional regulator [Kouleothrix sp.]HRC77040.1 MarR family transcriptional regulator [Kouleothrix sp.]
MKRTAHTHRSSLRQPAVLAWLRLARVFQKVDTRSERFFRQHGLNAAQFDVLAQVGAASGISQQELANALLVTKGNISQLLNRLEQDGLITRRQEGRTNCLSLTERGQELFAAVVPQQEALIAGMLAPLSADEQHELLRLLRKLDQNLPS